MVRPPRWGGFEAADADDDAPADELARSSRAGPAPGPVAVAAAAAAAAAAASVAAASAASTNSALTPPGIVAAMPWLCSLELYWKWYP